MDYYDNLSTFFVRLTMEKDLKPISSGDSSKT